MMDYVIGIDIGATKVIFVLMGGRLARPNFGKNLGGRVLKTKKILTPKTKKEIVEALKANIKQLSENCSRTITGIGIGVPGPLNKKRDLILNPPNLKSLRNCPLAKIIEKNLKIKTVMDNDVNCFTLGETVIGAGKSAKIVFGITLGSGVGGGIVINSPEKPAKVSSKFRRANGASKIYRGAFGSAGEVGHTIIKFDGPKCTCGSHGCFEEYCSERFFKRRDISPFVARKRAKRGDKFALNLYNEYGKYLGIGLANVINLLDPEAIVIGGGLATSFPFFIKSAKAEIKNRVISPIAKKYVKIKRAKLGDLSGAIGAALLVETRR